MVTLAGTQNLNEFELHLRAALSLPIPNISQEHIGVSAVILSTVESSDTPSYRGLEQACMNENMQVRIFGKPTTRINRRMGVVVGYDDNSASLDKLRERVKAAADMVEVY